MPQMGGGNFVVRPVSGIQQPQFPGTIPSAPTQQVVMVPNHLLQQAVSPFQYTVQNQQQQQMFAAHGMMPQFQGFVNPQQIQMLQQQQQRAASQQNQQQANQQQAQQQRSAGKPGAPNQQTSSPPQQATQPNQMNANQMQNQNQTPNQPSATPIHPMNQTQPFYVMNPAVHGYQNFVFARRPQQQIVAPTMVNPLQLQQMQQLQMQQHAARAQAQVQQQQLRNQQAQQQMQGKDDQQKQQTQALYNMQLQNQQRYANQQVRMGGPMPAMMQQPNPGANQAWNAAATFQPQQAQRQAGLTVPTANANAQPSRPPTGIPPTSVPNKPQISKPPSAKQSDSIVKGPDRKAEMMKQFAAVAAQEKPASPGPGKKAGTPLSAAAPVFVPGSFSSPPNSEPTPISSPPEKKDPTQAKILPTVVPQVVTAPPGVPAEQPKPTWQQQKLSSTKSPPQTPPKNAEAQAMQVFDPAAMKKVQESNNVKPEEIAGLVSGVSEIRLDDVSASDISSPKSILTLDSTGLESEADDDTATNDAEENKDDPLDVENRIYRISQLVKLAKEPENKEMHEILKSPKFNSIRAASCVAVHEIIDSSKMSRRNRRSAYNQGSGMSRDLFGIKKPKSKQTPKSNRKHHKGPKNHYTDKYPPLLRFDPLTKMNNSWWATHREKSSPIEAIRKKALALLNKLTLENKKTIFEQFTNHIVSEVKSIDECNVVVSEIFEKSCAEARFSNLYADLCQIVQSSLSGIKPNLEREENPELVKENEDMKGLFRRSIINLCQLNFNKRLTTEALEGTDEQIIAQLDNSKRKMMGNIKFIGDLFKHKLIHESIVHHIIAKLLTPRDKDYDSNAMHRRKLDDQLEGCCRLLQTVGKQIDVPKAKEWIDQYFEYIFHFQKNAQLRIQFMVMEIKELRDNKWIPRRETETVKLKKDIQKEFEREQMEKQRGPKRKHGDFRGRRDNTIRSSNSGGNAWGRARQPSSAPISSKKKSNSQDIRGFSSARSPNPSQPPQSARVRSQTQAINHKAIRKEWDDFGNSRRIDDQKLDKFLKKAGANPALQKARWQVFFKHFICNAQADTQKQMMICFRSFMRRNEISVGSILSCMKDISSTIESLGDEFDVPKAAEYYGYIVSELVATGKMSPKELVSTYAPSKIEKETSHNLYMAGVLKELSTLEDPDGAAFVAQHAQVLRTGFRLEPKDYGKPAKRKQLPSAADLPIVSVVLGEQV